MDTLFCPWKEGIAFRLLSRIVQRLHMPSLLYWGLGTSVYLHSSPSTPADLRSQSPYYISVTCMPVKILHPCHFMDPDLAFYFCSSGCFWCSCPRTCLEVLPKHTSVNETRGISHSRYLTRCWVKLSFPHVHHRVLVILRWTSGFSRAYFLVE